MIPGFDMRDAGLLLALQRGLPLDPRPFARLAQELGLTEAVVLERTASFMRDGLVRRFGAVFDARSLGYDSTLCAVDVPEADVEHVAAQLHPHPGITHCYQRSGAPALWFTMTAAAAEFARAIATAARLTAPYELLNLPTRRTFKIGVILDVRRSAGSGPAVATGTSRMTDRRASERVYSEQDRAVVRLLQEDLPLVAEPFAEAAGALQRAPGELLATLNEWQQQGILRRVALVPYHRELGFAVNGMCVWKVDPQRLEAAGRRIAAAPEVTHCYERALDPRFPFNLFAMLHAESLPVAEAARARLATAAGLSGGRMLLSIREFKKTSPRFFMEETLKTET
ncbi:MAG: hypothetical protein NTV49_00850 [Kiritimatiellaeota bacterium]|nr:hypothetical protein [Kiritimatiellota bacterium]